MVLSHRYQTENRIRGDELRKGDHVHVWRSKSSYSQHGIYVGRGMIVCFTNPNSGGSGLVYMLEWKLFQGERPLYRYEYGVSPSDFKNKRAGTCTTAKSDSPDTVKHRAKYLLSHGYGRFDLLKHNSEDLALYCKTGRLVIGGGLQEPTTIRMVEQPRASPPDELVDKVHAMEQRLEESVRRMRSIKNRQRAIERNQKIILEELKRKGNLETVLMKKIYILILIFIIVIIIMLILLTKILAAR